MGMLWPTLEFVLGVSMIITLLAGGHLVISHKIDVGQFVAFSTYMIMLIWPIIAVGLGDQHLPARNRFGKAR